jgi:hypothetical protein
VNGIELPSPTGYTRDMTMITTAGMYPLKLKFAPTAAATSSNGSQDSSSTSSSQASTADSINSSSSSSSITANGDKVLASVKRCVQLTYSYKVTVARIAVTAVLPDTATASSMCTHLQQ